MKKNFLLFLLATSTAFAQQSVRTIELQNGGRIEVLNNIKNHDNDSYIADQLMFTFFDENHVIQKATVYDLASKTFETIHVKLDANLLNASKIEAYLNSADHYDFNSDFIFKLGYCAVRATSEFSFLVYRESEWISNGELTASEAAKLIDENIKSGYCFISPNSFKKIDPSNDRLEVDIWTWLGLNSDNISISLSTLESSVDDEEVATVKKYLPVSLSKLSEKGKYLANQNYGKSDGVVIPYYEKKFIPGVCGVELIGYEKTTSEGGFGPKLGNGAATVSYFFKATLFKMIGKEKIYLVEVEGVRADSKAEALAQLKPLKLKYNCR